MQQLNIISHLIFRDNPRFGINDWQNEWDGSPKSYTFGEELNESQRKKLIKNRMSLAYQSELNQYFIPILIEIDIQNNCDIKCNKSIFNYKEVDTILELFLYRMQI